jgi:gliding motility-associated-like protein
MAIKQICIAVLVLLYFQCGAQNYCPNPGFEQLSACPSGAGNLGLASPWITPGAATDLFSFCHANSIPPGCSSVGVPENFAGYSPAHTGSSYAGVYTKMALPNHRTYVQAPLTAPMVAGQLYKVSAFFRRSGASRFATNRLGASFSTAALAQSSGLTIPVTPQVELNTVIADTSSWTPFSSYYTAVGGEAYITIGNFRNDAATTSYTFMNTAVACSSMDSSAFYYIDDITVTKITETLSVTGDTMICTGETTTITGITNTSGWWSLASDPTDTIVSSNNTITVNPMNTTTYLWNGAQGSFVVTVNVSSAPVAQLPLDTIICEGSSLILNGSGAGYAYSWSTGDTTASIAVSDSGQYVLSVNNGSCSARDTFVLSIIPTPEIALPATATVCENNSQFPFLDAGPGISYYWTPGGDTTQILEPESTGIYTVTVTHNSGCTRTASVSVTESCPETLFLPNAFTPNGDGKNDIYYGFGSNIFNYKILIYNRWGQLLFSSANTGINSGWDGRFEDNPLPSGVYTYLVSYEALKPNGKKKSERLTGYFLLYR